MCWEGPPGPLQHARTRDGFSSSSAPTKSSGKTGGRVRGGTAWDEEPRGAERRSLGVPLDLGGVGSTDGTGPVRLSDTEPLYNLKLHA